MQKTILIVTDNLPTQINGVVTTYKNIEACAVYDNYRVVYIDPSYFYYIDCPGYNEIKIAFPWNVGSIIDKINPDYIHIATEGPVGLSARLYLDKHNYKYNTAYHTKLPEGIKKLFGISETITWPAVRWFHKHSGKVLATTNTMVQELRQHGFDGKIVSWTRGVDRKIFDPKYRRLETRNSKYLLCVSRVSKEKNLEAFFDLDFPGYLKVMVGDGPMLEVYKKQYPQVIFTGYKTGVDLAEYYANADVFVFPSRWETFGIVMIESMACGTPVAAFPCQGPEDVVDEGVTGCLNTDLKQAVQNAILLNRSQVALSSLHWSWQEAWQIFKNNLVNK